MNALYLVIGAACILILAYRFYGGFVAAKVLVLREDRVTPAHEFENGKDYVPMNKWIAFGHHFAAIAAAGPLVGPILAAQFGFLPGTLWILIGAVIGGAVHDMVVLFASVRHQGRSLSDIAREEIGPIAGIAVGLAILFTITITMAGLSLVVVNALKNNPWGTFCVGATIPIAMVVGLLIKARPDKLSWWTALGMIAIVLAVVFGDEIKGTALGSLLTLSEQGVKLALPVYAFFAAALPVWFLLAPRDYLSSYMKIGTIAALAVGIIFVAPVMKMPALMDQFLAGGGPIIKGPVWPFVSITIACGAISGFHALIGSGTTPKMIDNEKDILLVGFGGMLVEAFVAIMALIAACVLDPADYFGIALKPETLAALHMTPVDLPLLSQMIGIDLTNRPGGAVTLAVGMADIFRRLPGMGHLMSYWYNFAILFEAVFILTAIDAGTRVARYIVQDYFGQVYPKLRDNNWLPGTVGASLLVSVLWGYLLYGGDIATVWPLFGVSNQLLASIALAIGTSLILRRRTNLYYGLVTAVPMVYLFCSVMVAGYWTIVNQYLPQGKILNVVLSLIMMGLSVVVMADATAKWVSLVRDRLAGKPPVVGQNA
jgi:carbon starvation protein